MILIFSLSDVKFCLPIYKNYVHYSFVLCFPDWHLGLILNFFTIFLLEIPIIFLLIVEFLSIFWILILSCLYVLQI